MNELKTLKDLRTVTYFETPTATAELVSKDNLKELTQKWIDEFNKHIIDTEVVVTYPGNFHYTHGMRCGAALFIKHFFNLEEK